MKYLLIFLFLASTLYALPESPHPYPNNYDNTERYCEPGALALEITFCEKTQTEKDRDFIIVQGTCEAEIGKFSGTQLAGQTLRIEGDTVVIRLVSDASISNYGYGIAKVRSILREEREPVTIDYSGCEGLYDESLKEELYNLVKNHVSLGYTQARTKMFGTIDNVNGYVRCVYTGILVKTTTIPDGNVMNTEHSWPQSQGAENEPAKSDLFHLFPTDSETNSRRSSYPFEVVVFNDWGKGGSYLGKNSGGATVFMPRTDHRGNVARAMFYFSIRYRLPMANGQENDLKRWNAQDRKSVV